MLKYFWILIILLLTVIPSQVALPLLGEKPELAVTGKGEVLASADIAYLQIAVERTEKTATEAQDTVARKSQNILASLEKIGVKKDKIETASFNLYPKYEYEKGESKFIGYTASNQIKVTIENPEDIGKVIDAAIAAGATNVSGLNFSVKDETPYKKIALQKAFEDAKGKAEILASSSGQILDKIQRIQESEVGIISPLAEARVMAAGAGGGAETPITPGKVKVQARIEVTYELAKKK